jgi:hypothetical protein
MISKVGQCHLCGEVRELTYEHVPPKKAFNNSGEYFSYTMDTSTKRWRKYSEHPYGIGSYTLCGPCNNNTGGGYAQAYVEFAKIAAKKVDSIPYRTPCDFHFKGFPDRIFKQILVMLCSTSGPGLSENNQWLRRLILNKKSVDFPKDARLYMYLVDQNAKLATGVAGRLQLSASSLTVVTEVVHWPIGAFLSFSELSRNECKEKYITDITDWGRRYCNRATPTSVTLFKNHRATAYPLDFRSKEEVEKEAGIPLPPKGVFPRLG